MSGGFRYTFPVIARGEVRTYDWERGSVAARYCLRRTYAVLTVSTGALWVPRSQPMQLVDGESPPRVPVEAGAGLPNSVPPARAIPPAPPPLDIPPSFLS